MRQHAPAVAVKRHVAGILTLALVASILVLAVGSLTRPAEAEDVHPEYGRTFAADGVLKRGCRRYSYGYDINPPQGDWALETFIIGPRGKRLASGAFVEGFDEEQDTGTFRICRPTTRAGVFKIKAKLSALDGDVLVEGWLPKSKFRLRSPG